jgi:hypothetical protein
MLIGNLKAGQDARRARHQGKAVLESSLTNVIHYVFQSFVDDAHRALPRPKRNKIGE